MALEDKPDWADVPERFNWLAMDSDGDWSAYVDRPVIDDTGRYWNAPRLFKDCFLDIFIEGYYVSYNTYPQFKSTIEQRPNRCQLKFVTENNFGSCPTDKWFDIKSEKEYCPICDGNGGISGKCGGCGK